MKIVYEPDKLALELVQTLLDKNEDFDGNDHSKLELVSDGMFARLVDAINQDIEMRTFRWAQRIRPHLRFAPVGFYGKMRTLLDELLDEFEPQKALKFLVMFLDAHNQHYLVIPLYLWGIRIDNPTNRRYPFNAIKLTDDKLELRLGYSDGKICPSQKGCLVIDEKTQQVFIHRVFNYFYPFIQFLLFDYN